MTDPYVPMPDTCHPHYADKADGIRSMLVGRRPIVVAEVASVSAFVSDGTQKPVSDAVIRQRIMDIKKCYGPAPFVGDPLWQQGGYFWWVAVDDLGRHVSGPAELRIDWRPAPLRDR